MYRYVTVYSNQVHQLVVSVSKHLFVTSDGRMKYQKKPFEISLAKLPRSSKEHVLHYLVRDHFSGVLYAELASSHNIIPIEHFLQRAWCEKSIHLFRGLPDAITVPRTVSEFFPELIPLLLHLDVDIIDATSGFQAGVRDLRTWEDEVRHHASWRQLSFSELLAAGEVLSADVCMRWPEEKSKTNLWVAGLQDLRVPSPGDFVLP